MIAMYNGEPIFGPRGPSGPDGSPIGTVISYMGLTAPQDYLVCDGAEYEISQYSELAKFFESQFGASNHFGGDGEATFAVPDLASTNPVLCCIKAAASVPVLEEYDTDDGWHVRKWSDGYVEMTITVRNAEWRNWQSMQFATYVPVPSFPVDVIGDYRSDVGVTAIYTSGFVGPGSFDQQGHRVTAFTSQTSSVCDIHLRITGKWKN